MVNNRLLGTFPDDKGVGNNIEWVKFPTKVAGWITPRPVEGDTFMQRMKSGKTAILKLNNVEYCDDPKDMFLAFVEFVDYVEVRKYGI